MIHRGASILDDPTIMDNVLNMTSRNDENTNSNLNKKEELDTKRVANQREKPLERKEMFLNQLKRKLKDPKGHLPSQMVLWICGGKL